MTGTNFNNFSYRSYYPARQYAATFPSPTEGNIAINTFPTGSFFQADRHQFTDPTNSESSVISIVSFAVKQLSNAYLATNRVWQLSELYPAALGHTQQSILKPQSHNRWLQLIKTETSSKGGIYE